MIITLIVCINTALLAEGDEGIVPNFEWKENVQGDILDVAMSENGELVLVGTNENMAYLFDYFGNELWSKEVDGQVLGVSIIPDEDGYYYFLIADSNKVISVLDGEGYLEWSVEIPNGDESIKLPNGGKIMGTFDSLNSKNVKIFGKNNGILLSYNNDKLTEYSDDGSAVISESTYMSYNSKSHKWNKLDLGSGIVSIAISSDYIMAGLRNGHITVLGRSGYKVADFAAQKNVWAMDTSDDFNQFTYASGNTLYYHGEVTSGSKWYATKQQHDKDLREMENEVNNALQKGINSSIINPLLRTASNSSNQMNASEIAHIEAEVDEILELEYLYLDVGKNIENTQINGANVTNLHIAFVSSRKYIENASYDEASSMLNNTSQLAIQIGNSAEASNQLTMTAKKRLSDAIIIGADVADYQNRIIRSESHISENMFEEANSILSKIINELNQTIVNIVILYSFLIAAIILLSIATIIVYNKYY